MPPTWLNAGGDATQVAEWAGNSVQVPMRVHAKRIHGREQINRKVVELGPPDVMALTCTDEVLGNRSLTLTCVPVMEVFRLLPTRGVTSTLVA